NRVRVTALGCHEERTIANVKLINENPLNIFLQPWLNAARKYRQFPEPFIGLDVPRLDVSATAIIIRRYVADAVVSNRLDRGWCCALGSGQAHRKHKQQKDREESRHRVGTPRTTSAMRIAVIMVL